MRLSAKDSAIEPNRPGFTLGTSEAVDWEIDVVVCLDCPRGSVPAEKTANPEHERAKLQITASSHPDLVRSIGTYREAAGVYYRDLPRPAGPIPAQHLARGTAQPVAVVGGDPNITRSGPVDRAYIQGRRSLNAGPDVAVPAK